MGTDGDLVALAEQLGEQVVDHAVEQVVFLPRRGDQDPRLVGDRRGHEIAAEIVEQNVAAGDQLLFGQTVDLLGLADLLDLLRTDAEDGVEVIHRALAEAHMDAHHIVRGVDIFDVTFDVGTLQLVGVEVGRGHHHDLRVHLHQRHDQFARTDIIGHETGLGLRALEDRVVGVVRDVVDLQIGAAKQFLDDIGVVFPESALFGIENEVLVGDVEKAFVVGFFAFPVGILPLRLAGAGELLEFRERRLALAEFLVVDVLLRIDRDIEKIHLCDRGEIRERPVVGDAGGNAESEIEREPDRERHHAVLVPVALLGLQDLALVLGEAEQPGRARGDRREDQRDPEFLDGEQRERKPEERHLQSGDRRKHRLVDRGELGGVCPSLDEVDRRQLDGVVLDRYPGDPRRDRFDLRDRRSVDPENVGQRVVDDLHDPEQKNELDENGDQTDPDVVAVFLVDLGVFLGNVLRVPEMVDVQPVDFGLHLDEFDAVVLHPHGKREQNDLRDQNEEQDRQRVVPRQVVTGTDHNAERRREPGQDFGHYSPPAERGRSPAPL